MSQPYFPGFLTENHFVYVRNKMTNNRTYEVEATNVVFMVTMVIRDVEVILSVLGNGLVLVAFYRCSYLRIPTGYLITSLSFCDMIGATLAPLVQVMAYHRGTTLWYILCHHKLFLLIIFVYGNNAFALLIALERFITLAYPKTILTTRRIVSAIFGVFVLLIVYATVVQFTSNISKLDHTECMASDAFPTELYNFGAYLLYFVLLCIGLIYLQIGRIAWKRSCDTDETGISSQKAQWKITKMITAVLVLYVLSYIPVIITLRLIHNDLTNRMFPLCYYIASVIAFCSTWINPLLYGYLDSHYRRAFFKILPTYVFQKVFGSKANDILPSTSNYGQYIICDNFA